MLIAEFPPGAQESITTGNNQLTNQTRNLKLDLRLEMVDDETEFYPQTDPDRMDIRLKGIR